MFSPDFNLKKKKSLSKNNANTVRGTGKFMIAADLFIRGGKLPHNIHCIELRNNSKQSYP